MAVQPINLQVSPESLDQGEQAIRQEIAIQLYVQKIFTFGQSRHLANLSVWEFQNLLGQKKISRHYDEEDLAQDIAAIQTGDWSS
jgi:predicted HTH domain antitoxin